MNKLNFKKITTNQSLILSSNIELGSILEEAERLVIKLSIERCKRNQSICAKALGISRGTLRTKLRKYFGDEYFRDVV